MNTPDRQSHSLPADGAFSEPYIYGRNAVIEALKAGRSLEKIYIAYGAEGSGIEDIRRLARNAGIRCAEADRRKFAELEHRIGAARGEAQSVIAQETMVTALDLQTLIEQAYEKTDTPVLVALDGINDPHNIGAVARAAECAGAQGLILPLQKSAPISPAAMKASAGALAYLPTAKAGTLEPALKDCKAAGFRIVGTDGLARRSYTELAADIPLVIIIGSEGTGMTSGVRRLCDELITIEMSGKISSLNASVAAGVILFRLAEGRKKLAAITK